MEQVKIFTRSTSHLFDELEKEVNGWLEANKGVEIISRHADVSAIPGKVVCDAVNCTIVIFYRRHTSDSSETGPNPSDVNLDDPDEELDSSV
jgi:hypothetical protein